MASQFMHKMMYLDKIETKAWEKINGKYYTVMFNHLTPDALFSLAPSATAKKIAFFCILFAVAVEHLYSEPWNPFTAKRGDAAEQGQKADNKFKQVTDMATGVKHILDVSPLLEKERRPAVENREHVRQWM